MKHDWADRHLAAPPRVELRVVEDAGLLQHGALLDAEERRVVLCSSNQASEQSASRNGDGRRDPRRNAPDLGRCKRGSGHIHARTGTRAHTHNPRRARARNGGTGRERQTRGADARARARTFLVEVVVLLHDERLRHGCGCCRGDARAREGARAGGGGARGFPRGPGGGLAGFGVEEARSLQEWRSVRHGSESGAGKGLVGGERGEGYTTLPVVEQRFLSFGCNSTVDTDALILDHIIYY